MVSVYQSVAAARKDPPVSRIGLKEDVSIKRRYFTYSTPGYSLELRSSLDRIAHML